LDKQCKKCGEVKPLTEYNKRQSRCKPCQYAYTNKWQTSVGLESKLKSQYKYAKSKSGVYGIFSGETCLYVGESDWLISRIANHKTRLKNPYQKTLQRKLYNLISQHSNVTFKVLEETPNHKQQEQVWIEKLNPLYNS